jgi:hypothetical protein
MVTIRNHYLFSKYLILLFCGSYNAHWMAIGLTN